MRRCAGAPAAAGGAPYHGGSHSHNPPQQLQTQQIYIPNDLVGCIIGKGGARLREVGTAARTQIEKLLGTKVYLDLHVKIAKNWQRDPKQLGRLGF